MPQLQTHFMNEDLAEAIQRIKRGYWNLREIVGLILAAVFVILLFVFGLDWVLRQILPTP